MAAKRPTLGVDHPTVVPTNFDPERRRASQANSAEDADERTASTGDDPTGDGDEADL